MVWEGGGLPFFSFGQEREGGGGGGGGGGGVKKYFWGGGGRGYCQKIMYDVGGGGIFKNFAP